MSAPVEVEHAAKKAAGGPSAPAGTNAYQPRLSRNAGVFLYLSVGFALILLLGWSAQNIARRIRSAAAISTSNWSIGTRRSGGAITGRASQTRQAEAERLLGRVAAGDPAAADQLIGESDEWIGKTQRTAKVNQLVQAALNQHDLHARAAALQATLAMDRISRDAAGLSRLELAVADPRQRAWALWMLGALGNRGVEQDHIAKTLGAFINDPDVRTRAGAVDGLGIVATDETVPMLLDRFRNDPSPVVQERAACDLAEAGMYTHEQRMVAAASMVGWLDDALLSPQQRLWTLQALRDIAGQNFGTDAAAWQRWYGEARPVDTPRGL